MSHRDIICKQSRARAHWLRKSGQWNIRLCHMAHDWICTNSYAPIWLVRRQYVLTSVLVNPLQRVDVSVQYLRNLHQLHTDNTAPLTHTSTHWSTYLEQLQQQRRQMSMKN